MADVPVPGYQTFWTNRLSTQESEHQTQVQQYPDLDAQLKQLLNVLGDIEDMARHIPASVGDTFCAESVCQFVKKRAILGKNFFLESV
jgi:hypothetical protein